MPLTIDNSTEISIHALRGEGDQVVDLCRVTARISIHALRGEGDLFSQPRYQRNFGISIHALRGEGDLDCLYAKPETIPFQSTPSVGRATSNFTG